MGHLAESSFAFAYAGCPSILKNFLVGDPVVGFGVAAAARPPPPAGTGGVEHLACLSS